MKRERRKARRGLPWEQVYARELLTQFRKTPPELVKNIDQFPPELWENSNSRVSE